MVVYRLDIYGAEVDNIEWFTSYKKAKQRKKEIIEGECFSNDEFKISKVVIPTNNKCSMINWLNVYVCTDQIMD